MQLSAVHIIMQTQVKSFGYCSHQNGENVSDFDRVLDFGARMKRCGKQKNIQLSI